MSLDAPTPGSWPDSPSKSNTNAGPQDETLRIEDAGEDGFNTRAKHAQEVRKGKIICKDEKIVMLPPEIIER